MIFLDLEFRVLRTIKSLPPWPGARWNALLRLAARAAGTSAEEAYGALVPQRWGLRPWLANEITRLRLLLRPDNLGSVRKLLTTLQAGELGEGEFTAGGSLALKGLTCPGQISNSTPPEILSAFLTGEIEPAPLNEEDLWPEMAVLQKIAENGWDVEIVAPLRLSRPVEAPGSRDYAGPEFFDWPGALSRLLARVRLPGEMEINGSDLAKNLTVVENHLRWRDLVYSRERGIKLGGVTGHLRLGGRLDFEEARRLIWGQYLGVGKNGRFGLGFYRMPQLDSARLWPLYPEVSKNYHT